MPKQQPKQPTRQGIESVKQRLHIHFSNSLTLLINKDPQNEEEVMRNIMFRKEVNDLLDLVPLKKE